MIFGLIIIYILILIFDIPVILKTNNRRKTIIIYSVLLGVSFIISILLMLEKMPTTPSIVIEQIVKTVFMR
ncbi:hypothetical protein [Caloranaerobacter azorensis]|uniref:Uncharacterized protein n=3 Tax=Caloranaerobacter azorensis TaxID=116090 RepID=A0A1M5UR19_9FIRM|nr:hypothetical protein [Caloranaerobacter azorensis]KGG81251.1 hypothetical protein Y919_01740 [Caloranaerobacter azorensis H53214]QIB27440.1 hypothetical protein G3A45_09155 [Caloranaerobacter azorensis]SHH65268.1 hypothetical protein SAMN02745135_01537 [Caloranaerobacter azorensis DSM 13643]